MIKPKLKVDDRVRSIACSSKAIYPARLGVLPTYKINELEGTLKGMLYADNLQKVTVMGLWATSGMVKVVKRKVDKGWPDKFDSD